MQRRTAKAMTSNSRRPMPDPAAASRCADHGRCNAIEPVAATAADGPPTRFLCLQSTAPNPARVEPKAGRGLSFAETKGRQSAEPLFIATIAIRASIHRARPARHIEDCGVRQRCPSRHGYDFADKSVREFGDRLSASVFNAAEERNC